MACFRVAPTVKECNIFIVLFCILWREASSTSFFCLHIASPFRQICHQPFTWYSQASSLKSLVSGSNLLPKKVSTIPSTSLGSDEAAASCPKVPPNDVFCDKIFHALLVNVSDENRDPISSVMEALQPRSRREERICILFNDLHHQVENLKQENLDLAIEVEDMKAILYARKQQQLFWKLEAQKQYSNHRAAIDEPKHECILQYADIFQACFSLKPPIFVAGEANGANDAYDGSKVSVL